MPTDTPDAPGKPVVEDVDADSVTLSWTKPRSDGGDKITGYVIEAKEKGTDKWKPLNERHPCRDTTFTGTDKRLGIQMFEFRTLVIFKA